jgi:hypothetical protein
MTEPTPAALGGRLALVLETRGGSKPGGIHLENREALIYTLGKAAELEHLIMLQYLYAAFSLKGGEAEGLSPDGALAVQRWRKTLIQIAEQEMLHMALVQNMLTAIGAAPRLARPNYPVPAYHYPAGVQVRLMQFGETALRHFAFLERPQGMSFDDAEGFEALGEAVPLPDDLEDAIAPQLQDFDTIGTLYRSMELGFDHLAERLGEDKLFVGQPNAQATESRTYTSPWATARTASTSSRSAALFTR